MEESSISLPTPPDSPESMSADPIPTFHTSMPQDELLNEDNTEKVVSTLTHDDSKIKDNNENINSMEKSSEAQTELLDKTKIPNNTQSSQSNGS